jgi:hypothetical protein
MDGRRRRRRRRRRKDSYVLKLMKDFLELPD